MKPFKIYRLRDEFITNFLAARHCFLLSLVSFIIDSPPQLFLLHRLEFFLSRSPVIQFMFADPFLCIYFLSSCTLFFFFQLLARQCDLYAEALNQTQYDAIFFSSSRSILRIDKALRARFRGEIVRSID